MSGGISWRLKAVALFAALFAGTLLVSGTLDLQLVSLFSDNLLLSDLLSILLVFGAFAVAADLSGLLAITGVNINVAMFGGSAKDRFHVSRSPSPGRLRPLFYCAVCAALAVPVALAHTVYCNQLTQDRCLIDGYDAVSAFGWPVTFVLFVAVFAILLRGTWALYRVSERVFDPDVHLNLRILGARD